MTDHDRLAEIKNHFEGYKVGGCSRPVNKDWHVEWLIAEVERLRRVVDAARRYFDYNESFTLPRGVVARHDDLRKALADLDAQTEKQNET